MKHVSIPLATSVFRSSSAPVSFPGPPSAEYYVTVSETVTLTRRDGIAVVTIDNPPVNALKAGVPEAIRDAVLKAAAEPEVAAIVVIGAGSTFVAGVDIREFGKTGQLPFDLTAIVNEIEDCPKPVVMALHGNALGGGLELAMGGHYRVIAPSAQVGQPGGENRADPRCFGHAAFAEACQAWRRRCSCVCRESLSTRAKRWSAVWRTG